MAPHADNPLVDTSGYQPSIDSIKALREALALNHPGSDAEQTWISAGPKAIDSHDREEEYEPWVLQLDLDDLQEIEEAVQCFEGSKLPINKLQAEHFPLPTLSLRLRELSLALPDKQPYFLIRGLKPQWFSKYKNIIIFTGIASHVGTKRAMAGGEPSVLQHITNIRDPAEEQDKTYKAPGNSDKAIPFHNDLGEIVSLYTLSRAATGGDFYLADIYDIEARIRRIRPDILDTLRKPWLMMSGTEDYAYDERPLLFTLPSRRLAIQLSRARLFGTSDMPRPSTLPPLSPSQVEALDAFHTMAQEVALRFEFRSGDIVFFNNLRMVHARDAFVDGNEEENTTRRYLLRLITRDERNQENWEVPKAMDHIWKQLYEHEDANEIFPIHEERFSYKAGP